MKGASVFAQDSLLKISRKWGGELDWLHEPQRRRLLTVHPRMIDRGSSISGRPVLIIVG